MSRERCLTDMRIKRADTRFGWTGRCDVFHEHGAMHAALLMDISRHGAKISYSGGQLGCGLAVMVHIATRQMLLSRSATVVWSGRADGGRAASGLRFLAPVPEISLIIFSREARDHFFN